MCALTKKVRILKFSVSLMRHMGDSERESSYTSAPTETQRGKENTDRASYHGGRVRKHDSRIKYGHSDTGDQSSKYGNHYPRVTEEPVSDPMRFDLLLVRESEDGAVLPTSFGLSH